MNAPETLILYGCHEPDYPRNRTIRATLEQAGFSTILCHSRASYPRRHWELLRQLWPWRHQARWIWVTEGGYRILPILWLFLRLTRSRARIVYDPFISRVDTYIEDRKLHTAHSLQGRILWWHDFSATHLADALVFDTRHHKDYFYAHYALSQPSLVVPVLIPEDVFRPLALPAGKRLEVLFYGTFIPLQGVDTLVRAISLLQARPDIHFTLIGNGQTRPATEALAQSLPPGHATWLGSVAESALPGYIANADVCLGIFGATEKAARVVPNKVVQTAAMGKAIITRDSAAIRDSFTDGESALLVPADDAEALARAIVQLAAAPALRVRLGEGARSVFLRQYSQHANAQRLRDWFHDLDATPDTF